MINSRLEAKALRIWLLCTWIAVCVAVGAFAYVNLIPEAKLYEIAPFLDFKLTVEGEIFGHELPQVITDNFSFACTLAVLCAAFGLLLHIIYVFVLNVLRAERSHAAKVLKRQGYSKEYYEILERKHRKLSGTSLGARNDLLLAKAYADGRKYDSAFEILRDIDIDSFDSKLSASYYNLYARLFILTGDIDGAKKALAMGSEFIEKHSSDSDIRLTKALLRYAEGDYASARKRFENLLNCKPVEVRVWAGLYLGLVYLRLHNKELAKKLACTLGGYKKTPRQSEDMLKLLKKIEAAYALEEQEALESK